MNISTEDLEELFALIDKEYSDNHSRLSRHLFRAIYSLHFLDDGDVPRSMVQDTCFTLYQLGECFYQAEEKRHLREREHLAALLAKARGLSGKVE